MRAHSVRWTLSAAIAATGLFLNLASLAAAQPGAAQTPPTPASAPDPAAAPTDAPSPPQPRRLRAGAFPRGGPTPDNVEVITDVIYAEAPATPGPDGANSPPVQLTMDVAYAKAPEGDGPLPAVIYIHGGGYVSGSKEAGRPFLANFAQGGYFVASINYRLADVAPFPAAVHDCKAAVRFIRAHAADLGVDPQRIGVWGHSAGGHLSALLATTGNARDLDDPVREGESVVSSAVQCIVDVSGPSDFIKLALHHVEAARNRGAMGDNGERAAARQLLLDRGELAWFGGRIDERRELARLASPQTFIDADDPPFLIVHGTGDRLVPLEQAELLRDAISKAGGRVEYLPVEGAGHGIAEPRVYRRIAQFFDDHLGGSSAGVLDRLADRMRARDGEAPPAPSAPPAP